ncbi:helix-turn-helix domain-containing protein [Candidatus Gottesmanbacteria bacterium]|nr:helix-turn-helix domain-containing protein [Candidatus Gottesmanbacteria bacterium]
MMNTFTETTKLKELGLEEKQSQIYLTLLKNGVLSPLELSRLTDLNRTTVYRILEELENKGLVEEVVDGKSVKAKAASPDKLRLLLISEETKLQRMKNTIPDLITKLSVVKDVPSSSTKVFYFRGKTGIQQLLWNTLKGSTLRESSTKENVGFGYMGWNESVGLEFADELRRELWDIAKEINLKKQS